MAGGRGKIQEHPNKNKNGFRDRPQDAGRPKKFVTEILEHAKNSGYKVTAYQVGGILEYLLTLPLHELKQIAGRPEDESNEYPALMRIFAHELLSKNKLNAINSILDRAHGKPGQSLKIEGGEDVGRNAPAPVVQIVYRREDEQEDV